MTAWNIPAAIVADLLIAGCSAQPPEAPAQQHCPQQAGQSLDPIRVASRVWLKNSL